MERDKLIEAQAEEEAHRCPQWDDPEGTCESIGYACCEAGMCPVHCACHWHERTPNDCPKPGCRGKGTCYCEIASND